jgi:RND family efflux transporter MFP subunit
MDQARPADGVVIEHQPFEFRKLGERGSDDSIIDQLRTLRGQEGASLPDAVVAVQTREIPDLKHMIVNAKVHEVLASRVHKGQSALVRVESFPDQVLSAHVDSVSTVAAAADFLSADVKLYTTKIAIDKAIEGLKPGMSAEVAITIGDALEHVLTVPIEAIIGAAEMGKTRKVFVLTPDGPKERNVVIGDSNHQAAEICKGLQEGEEVVLNPKALVGDKVKTRKRGEYQGEDTSGKPVGPTGPGTKSGPGGPGKPDAGSPGKGPGGKSGGSPGPRRSGETAHGWSRRPARTGSEITACNRKRGRERIPEEDIKEVHREARAAITARGKANDKGKAAKEQLANWSRVRLIAPIDGTLVERNVSRHQIVVDGTRSLFQIANLDRLLVLATVPEEDLPRLETLKATERRWTVRAAGSGPVEGVIDEIDYLIDPTQHTAVVKGPIDNKDHQLRAGQFITATITLPLPAGEVVLPATAVVEDGRQTFVFVQPDAKKPFYEQRRVSVVRRAQEAVPVRFRLTAAQQRQGFQAVRPGERIVTAGVLELKAILDGLKAGEDR